MSIVQSAQHSDTSGTSHSVTLPSTPTRGNTVVVFATTHGSVAPTGPTGYTQRYNTSAGTAPGGSANLIGCWFKTAGASESATVTVTTAANQQCSLVVVELAGNILDNQTAGSTTTASSVSSPGFTTKADDYVLAAVHGCPTSSTTSSWDDGFSPVINAQSPSTTDGTGIYVATKDVSAGVATGTVTATMGLTLPWRAIQIGFTPIPVVQSKGSTGAVTGTISVTLDSAPIAGNILLCSIESANNGTQTGPSGWTQLLNGSAGTTPSGANALWGIWYKIATVGESATVSGSLSVTSRYAMAVVEIAASAFDTWQLSAVQSGTAPTATGFTTGVNDCILTVFAGSPTSTETPTFNDNFFPILNSQTANSLNGAGIYIAAKKVASGVATGTVTATFASSVNWRSAQVGFSVVPPAQSVSPTGIGSGEAFGTPTITPGPVTISPTGIGSGEAFGTPVINGAVQLEEVYVEAITDVAGEVKLDQVYVEAATSKQALSQLDQVYVEVLWSVPSGAGWKGWGIKL